MKPLAFNLRDAKKISGDRHSSTFVLKDGHQMRIAHAPLSSLHRKMIEKMPIMKMADGGKVDSYSDVPLKETYPSTGNFVSDNRITKNQNEDNMNKVLSNVGGYSPEGDEGRRAALYQQNAENDYAERNSRTSAPDAQMYADGGEIDSDLFEKTHNAIIRSNVRGYYPAQNSNPDSWIGNMMNGTNESIGNKRAKESLKMANGGGVDSVDENGNEYASEDGSQESKNASIDTLSKTREGDPNGPLTSQDVNDLKNNPYDFNAPLSPQANQGMPPDSNAPATVVGNDPYGSQNALQAQIDALSKVKEGQLGENRAQSMAAHRQANIEQDFQDNQAGQVKRYQDALMGLNKEGQSIANDVASGHIDPQRFIHNLSTGSKIAKGIGLMLGAVGTGVSGGRVPNYAFDVVQKQIDNDIKAQAMDLGRKESLLNYNLAQTGNLNTAQQLTALQTNAIFASKFRQNAQYATNAAESSKNLQIAGMFDGKIADLKHQIALQHALLGGQPGQTSEQEFQNRMKYLRINGQDKAATEMEKKHIPGLPGAASSEVTQKNREEWQNLNNLQKNYNDAQDYMNKVGKLGTGMTRGSPGLAAQGRSIQDAMTLEMGKLADLQRFTPEEKKLYVERVPDLTGTHFTSQDQMKLSQLQKELMDHVNTFKSGLGYGAGAPAQSDSGSSRNEALMWARDPKNAGDPRLPKVMKKLGIK